MSDNANRENRSVNDFHSPEDLQQALESLVIQRSAADGEYVSFRVPALGGQYASVTPVEQEESAKTVSSQDGAELDNNLDWVLENYDETTTDPQTLAGELQRLLVLKSYLILDDERKEAFERITGLASRIFQCSMALISLVDLGRQWFMSNRGLGDIRETPRKYAFCAHTIRSKEDFMIVPDAREDFRFKNNPLVTGPPYIRFYAGAALISPEGYKLGTLCVLDRKPRPEGLSLEDKQNLMELAALAVQSIVDHKRAQVEESNDPAQLIACTAHDLLTPLTGVHLSLSLLMEDEEFSSMLTPQQNEMITTASNCTDVMGRICQTAIDSFRKKQTTNGTSQNMSSQGPNDSKIPIVISDFVKSLYMVINPFPKQVPLSITVDPSVPDAILTHELKVFRSALNFLTNACAKTETGSVHLSIGTAEENGGKMLLFECKDTGPGVLVETYPQLFRPYKDESTGAESASCMKTSANGGFEAVSQMRMPNSGLGLYSVAIQISSLGGEYGFRPRSSEIDLFSEGGKPVKGSVFWFKIPLILPGVEGDRNIPDTKSARSMHSFSHLNQSLSEVNEGYNPIIRILGTPLMSRDLAEDVSSSSFTRILEDQIPANVNESGMNTNAVALPPESIQEGQESVDGKLTPMVMTKAIPLKVGETRKRKVLVIEDSLVVRKSLTRVLIKLGFEAVQAVDGMEGLKELQCALFDVVLCDFLMPVMDGLDCVQQYREWEATYRPFFRQHIIGISAHAGEKDIARGREVGMDDFKPKPVTYKQLTELQNSKELKIVSDRLDEIAAAGTVMVDTSENAENYTSHAFEVDMETEMASSVKRSKIISTSVHFCLIGIEKGKTETAELEKAASSNGWKSISVRNGEDALRLMKVRNWDVVLLDEGLPMLHTTQCVARFREWENQNRVNRQRNIVLLNASCVSMVTGAKSMVQLPFGFDASLTKPICVKEFELLMAQAGRSQSEFGVRDFVLR